MKARTCLFVAALLSCGTIVRGEWLVLDVKASSPLTEGDFLNSALGLFDGSTPSAGQVDGQYRVVNFYDYTRDGGGAYANGHFSGDSLFPGYSGYALNLNAYPRGDDDFAIRAVGNVYVPTTGWYTIGISSDDGSRLLIDDVPIFSDPNTHATYDAFRSLTLTSGWHCFDFVYFERDGFASVELYAAPGISSSFHSGFRLIGDTANGGLEVMDKLSPVPEPTSIAIWGVVALMCVAGRRWRYVSLPASQ